MFFHRDITMKFATTLRTAAAAVLLTVGAATAASAVTYDFDTSLVGFSGTGGQIVSGNGCFSGDCLQINSQNGPFELSYSMGTFSALSFLYRGDGSGSEITVSSTSGGPALSFSSTLFVDNPGGGQDIYKGVFTPTLTGLTSLFFDSTGNGTVRIDNIEVTPASPIPLPATGLLLLGGLGIMGLRRKKRAA